MSYVIKRSRPQKVVRSAATLTLMRKIRTLIGQMEILGIKQSSHAFIRNPRSEKKKKQTNWILERITSPVLGENVHVVWLSISKRYGFPCGQNNSNRKRWPTKTKYKWLLRDERRSICFDENGLLNLEETNHPTHMLPMHERAVNATDTDGNYNDFQNGYCCIFPFPFSSSRVDHDWRLVPYSLD